MIQPDVASRVIDKFSQMASGKDKAVIDERVEMLTSREQDICRLSGEGKNNKEIATKRYLSEGTVKNHVTNILNKLELRDRTQLAIFQLEMICVKRILLYICLTDQ